MRCAPMRTLQGPLSIPAHFHSIKENSPHKANTKEQPKERRERIMPVITLEGPKMTKEQKAKLVNAFVAGASEILNIPEQAFVTILRENDYDNIGSGTALLSEKMK